MTDGRFWRRLAKDFRSIPDPPRRRMSATWAPLGWGVPKRHVRWRLEGGQDESERERFELIATNAAVALGHRRNSRAWIRWLEILKGRAEVPKSSSSVQVSRAVKGRLHELRQMLLEIPNICEVSALYCELLAAEAAADQIGQTKAAPVGPLANTLRILKEECGWSNKKLAAKVGLSEKTVASHLRGEMRPTQDSRRMYARVFQVELERPVSAADLLSGRALRHGPHK